MIKALFSRLRKKMKDRNDLRRKMYLHDRYGPQGPEVKTVTTAGTTKSYRRYPLSGRWVNDADWSETVGLPCRLWNNWTEWELFD